MKPIPSAVRFAIASSLLIAASAALADNTRFSDFEPLPGSAGPTSDEASPITFGNSAIEQRSIVERNAMLAASKPSSGNFDMLTSNETGAQPGCFLFTVFETDEGGVLRHDLWTNQTDTVWHAPNPSSHVAFDASYWTPWGTFITAEESWSTAVAGATSPYGRLFELKNPIGAPGITEPRSANSNDGADFVHQNVIPRTSHEGIQFDKQGNMYFIDELNGGNAYKYTSAAKFSHVLAGIADYFAAGQTFVLRVADGNTPNATGSYTWVPITDTNGDGLPGALVITDSNGVTSVDARNTTNLPAFKGTDYQRPEDLQIQTLGDSDYLYVATTTTNEISGWRGT